MNNNKVKDLSIQEKLRWFQIFASLYDIASPYINFFSDLQFHSQEELSVDVEIVEQNALVIRKVLMISIHIPEPPEETLISAKKYFETALLQCLNVSESLIKFMQSEEHTTERQIQFNNVINYLVLAREYTHSTYRLLNP